MNLAVSTAMVDDDENRGFPTHGRVRLGVIVAPHGLRGEVRIKCFTEDPNAIAAYGPLSDQHGSRRFELEIAAPHKGGVRARIKGCTDRDQADALRGVILFVDRDALPQPETDEFYHADLEGLRVERARGGTIGMIAAVHNFGAGDLLEIRRPDEQALLIPFTREAVPEVDIEQGRIVIDDARLTADEAE